MYFIIESSAFGQEGTGRKKTNRALFALTYCSHANLLSSDAQMINGTAAKTNRSHKSSQSTSGL
jgi:hypothetical protein